MSGEPRNCIVMRREGDKLSTRGPLAMSMTEAEASEHARSLGRQYPNQQFVVMTELKVTETRTRVNLKVVKP